MLSPERIVQQVDRDAVVAGIVAFLPNLRAFCASLARDEVRGEDLAQTAVMLALANLDSFEPGTRLGAWLFTIARNRHYTEWRKLRREVEDSAGLLVGQYHKDTPIPYGLLERLAVGGEDGAVAGLDYGFLEELLDQLPTGQREALQAVCIAGMSHEDAADVLGCAVGTVKSRLNRARTRLVELMGGYEMRGLDEAPSEEGDAWRKLVATGALDDYGEERDA